LLLMLMVMVVMVVTVMLTTGMLTKTAMKRMDGCEVDTMTRPVRLVTMLKTMMIRRMTMAMKTMDDGGRKEMNDDWKDYWTVAPLSGWWS
jgi:hypothetical protein